MEQAPVESKAKIISPISTLETLPQGEAVTDSGQFLQPTNRYTPEEHDKLKQLNTNRIDGQDRVTFGMYELERDTTQLRVALRFAPEQREIQRKRISNFFLQDANETPGLTEQTSSSRFLSRDSFQQLPSDRQLISTRSKRKIMQERKISRSQLEEMFLERADVLVSEDMINHVFHQADTEGTGFVHADDVANYINSIEPRTQKERQNYICRSILMSLSFWCAIFFVVGAIANIATNLRQREYGDLYGKSHYCWQVGAWAFQVGCFGFFFLDYDFEKIAFERLQLTNQKLVGWIRRGTYPL
jgi:hypothetical protein